ncbi:unnamed protein product [Eruca vesicaria subsp. sativa]|uniref:Pentatricopeptide repeat-containing protein n=1 Tax=Eruca vesicaria subsp. sativa TaxID=29727 RepID=A0ABC8LS42_ERUVS|nr:unnamed protein product [Eruca vesicaria subsp. sativa]
MSERRTLTKFLCCVEWSDVQRMGHESSGTWTNVRTLRDAFPIFDEMTKAGHHPSFFTYGSLLKGLCKGGHLKEVEKFLRSLHDVPAAVDTVMYNTVLTAMCRSGSLDKAVSLFGEMVQRNILPDSYTYTSLLSGLCRKGKTVIAILFVKEAEARGNLLPNEVMYTCFVDSMFKAGQWEAAFHFREQMEKLGLTPDTVTTNVMIDGYSRMGKIEKTNHMLSEMEPNLTTYSILCMGIQRGKTLGEKRAKMTEILENIVSWSCENPEPSTGILLLGHLEAADDADITEVTELQDSEKLSLCDCD